MARRLALITGASSGIGAAFARRAALNGCDVALVARRVARLEALAEEVRRSGIEALVAPADLSEPGAVDVVMDAVVASGRTVDILVNNAGYSLPRKFAATAWDDQRKFMQVTALAPAAFAHRVLPAMRKNRWGRIINISSITAFSSGGAGHTLYPAAKSFLVKFSQSLNAEVARDGVRVTAVCPGFVKTEFHIANDTAKQFEGRSRLFWQRPEEIAEESWRRNDAGVEVVAPGFAPKIAAALLKLIPEAISKPIIRKAAEKYSVED